MNKIIFTLLTVGLSWSSFNFTVNAFDFSSKKKSNFNSSLNSAIYEEKPADSQEEDDKEFSGLDYLLLNGVSKKLSSSKLLLIDINSSNLFGFTSTIFTPPPNLS